MNYIYAELPSDPNDLIKRANKTKNYVINGLFLNTNQIKIISEYFNIRVIHFKYNREDLPKHAKFFDQEHDILPFLKTKDYYF